MLNEYLGQEYPEGRELSMCHTASAPMQHLEKGGSLGLPKSIDQEPPLQCVGTKRRRGELKPCHDYTGKGGRRMTPYNTEVSSSTLRIGHDILQPSGGESIAETCAPAIQTTPINVHGNRNINPMPISRRLFMAEFCLTLTPSPPLYKPQSNVL